MSKQRSQKLKQDVGMIPEESALVTPIPEGKSPADLPFDEFSDHEINNEKWDSTPTVKEKLPSTQILFQDPHKIHLPPGLVCQEWKKCSELFPEVSFVVFSPITVYPDLVTPNPHLVANEFYKSYISSVEALLYIGTTRPFPTEYGTNMFFTSGAKQWRPWHHIYSNCKVEKGEHNPSYNLAGKYVVRLFWLGAWRKVYVDDYLPIDKSGNILLPTLDLPKSIPISDLNETVAKSSKMTGKPKKGSPVKKDVIQLWPMLLCKGLLKIASLSLNGLSNGYVDFDMVNCLTGWVPQVIPTKGVAGADLWDIFMAYVQRFEWSETKDGSTKKDDSTKSKSKSKEQKGGSNKQYIPIGIENMQDGDRHVVLTCNGVSESNSSAVRIEITVMLLNEVRDVPLIQPPPRPELEFWKTFRYEKWAEEQGIIPQDIKKLNIKSLKIVNPFKRISEIATETDSVTENADQGVDHSDKKSVKSSKSSKKNGKPAKFAQLQPDPSMWLDFDQLKDIIHHITIYFQPRCFKDKTMISDLQFPNKAVDFRYTISRQDQSVREPIYLFMDSVDYKFVIFNLCQMGNTSALQKIINDEIPQMLQNTSNDLDICDTIVFWKTRKELSAKSSEKIQKESSIIDSNNKPVSLVLEQYTWDSNELGPCTGTLNTLGNKSFMVDLKPGRSSFRLWISAQGSYVLQIFSDTPAVVCCLEEYLITSATESQLLKNLCYEISSCYGKLVQAFGRPEFLLCLRNFYQCYKPYQNLTKRESILLHKAFFEEFCNIISENATTPNAVYAINLLFLQLKTFDYVNPYLEEPHLYPSKFKLDNQVEYAKLMQRAAVKIQAYFKSFYIRMMLKKVEESHKEYYGLFNTMKGVYSDIFSSVKRLNYCPIMLRRILERDDIRPLLPKIDLHKDIHSVLYNQVFSGVYTGPFSLWLPIFRYDFFVNSTIPVKVKIKAFSTLKQITVRVFNNDSLVEVKSMLGSPIVDNYLKNEKGYTILCYGWTDDAPKVSWKLIVSINATSKNDLITVPVSTVTTLSLKDSYIPNFNNIICRYSLRLLADSVLTVNLTTSLAEVVICLTFYDSYGNKIWETYGTRNAIFPIVYLNHDINASFPAVKKRINSLSGTSEITYSKLGKYNFAAERGSYRSSTSRKDSSLTERVSEVEKSYARSNSTIHNEENDTAQNTGNGSDVRSQGKKAKTSRSSISSKNKNTSKSFTSANGSESFRTEFVLEAKVVDETWPLTAEEWTRVQKLREKSYLNLLDERKSLLKRQSVSKKSMTRPLDEPFYVLDVLYSSSSPIEFEQDRSKSETTKCIKTKWFTDIERYKRAMELRRNYISEHSILKSIFYIDPAKRSNIAKDFWPILIGQESLLDYMTKPPDQVDETSCITKCTDDYIIEDANLERKIKQHREDRHATQDELESQLQEQKENFDIIDDWFEGVRRDSTEMINDALEMKQQYVQKLLNSKKPKSEKKSKRDKK